MPNWTENRILIHGSATKVKEFVDYVKQKPHLTVRPTWGTDVEEEDELCPFTFQSIIPVPMAIQMTSSPANVVSIETYNEWFEKGLNNQLDEFEKMRCPITKEMQETLITQSLIEYLLCLIL